MKSGPDPLPFLQITLYSFDLSEGQGGPEGLVLVLCKLPHEKEHS